MVLEYDLFYSETRNSLSFLVLNCWNFMNTSFFQLSYCEKFIRLCKSDLGLLVHGFKVETWTECHCCLVCRYLIYPLKLIIMRMMKMLPCQQFHYKSVSAHSVSLRMYILSVYVSVMMLLKSEWFNSLLL